MKTRTIEVPVCDLCERDATVLTVIDLQTKDSFLIARCDRHVGKLRSEAGVEGTSDGKRTRVANREDALLQTVKENPGHAARDYAELLGWNPSTVHSTVYSLKKKGLLKAEGKSISARYFAVSPKASTPRRGKPRSRRPR